jgi:hypothetical protein
MVEGRIYGLTAGHPFKAHPAHNTIYDEVHDIGQDLRFLEDDESSKSSEEPFVFNDNDDDSLESLPRASTMSVYGPTDRFSTSTDDPTNERHDISKLFSTSVKWSQPYNAIIPRSAPNNASSIEEPLGDCDWALLQWLPRSITELPNKIAHIDPRYDILVERTVSGPAYGEVTITVASIGSQLGFLNSSPASMKIEKSLLDVQLITLEHVLRKFGLERPLTCYIYTDQFLESARKLWRMGNPRGPTVWFCRRHSTGRPMGIYGTD